MDEERLKNQYVLNTFEIKVFQTDLDVLDEVGLDVVDELLAGERLGNSLTHLGVRNQDGQHTGNVGENTC
jgi:hypothetical protein